MWLDRSLTTTENRLTSGYFSLVSTGCTTSFASNSVAALGSAATPTVDDGSCQFEPHPAGEDAGEHGLVYVTDSWQRVQLHRSYTHPVVIAGVITRQSTTQAIVRLQNVEMDPGGSWSFEIRAEQKSCHFAMPPPSQEQASFLVLQAGISAEGFQAGIMRVHDVEWHRVSFLPEVAGPPVVVSQVQTYDNRTSFVSSRHKMGADSDVNASGVRSLAFFVQAQGEGVCTRTTISTPTEYFDSIDLSGAPSWNWHATSGGTPPSLLGKVRSLDPMLFSARWTTRLRVGESDTFSFSSLANKGSRIVVDGVAVLSSWAECCSTFSTEPVPLSAGYHTVVYEYRSGLTTDYTSTDSYATLSWVVGEQVFAGPRAPTAAAMLM